MGQEEAGGRSGHPPKDQERYRATFQYHHAAKVQEDQEFRPVAVSLEGKTFAVVSIDERVAEEAEWWEPEPVFKMNYAARSI